MRKYIHRQVEKNRQWVTTLNEAIRQGVDVDRWVPHEIKICAEEECMGILINYKRKTLRRMRRWQAISRIMYRLFGKLYGNPLSFEDK